MFFLHSFMDVRILDLSISKYFDSLKKYQKEHLAQGQRILVISKDQQGRPISKETTKTAQKICGCCEAT